MDFPVPSHLKEFLVPEEEPGSEYEVTGNICCTCGSMYFEVLENNNKQVVKLICRQCKKEILLLILQNMDGMDLHVMELLRKNILIESFHYRNTIVLYVRNFILKLL